jgi:hypothetical protein
VARFAVLTFALALPAFAAAPAAESAAAAKPAAAPAAAPAPANEPIKSAFGPGEQSNFVVSYLGVPAGEFQLTVGMLMKRDGVDVWPILSIAKTGIPIYTINDKYIAYWDFRTQHHVGTDFWIDEKKQKRREHVYMKRDEGKATVKYANIGEPLKEKSYDINPDALDVSCAVMWLRNIPLEVGKKYQKPVFTGAVAFDMTADVLEKTKITNKALGEIEVYKIAVFTQFAGQLAQKSNLTAYFSADSLQRIVRIEAEFLLGHIDADLVSYEAGRDFSRG